MSIPKFHPLAIFCAYTAWFVSDLFGNHIVGLVMTQLFCYRCASMNISTGALCIICIICIIDNVDNSSNQPECVPSKTPIGKFPFKKIIGVPVKVIYLYGTSSIYSVCLSVVLFAFSADLVQIIFSFFVL